jgi:hypothetical protein
MSKGLLQKLLPHIIAIVLFWILAAAFCAPAFRGEVLQQADIVGVKGMQQNLMVYLQHYGHLPLWNISLFSGMPNYQILIAGPSIIPPFTKIFGLGLPEPANFFFIASLCFYFLCLSFRTNPYLAILGALAFAFCTYDPIIIATGHITKMMAISFAPGLLAGLVLLFRKQYWLGAGVSVLFSAAEMTANHPQISYYLFIVIALMTISYLVVWIKQREFKHAAIALSLALVAAAVGLGTAAVTIFPTYQFSKYTMRGGKTIEQSGNTVIDKKTKGLDLDYAFRWSLGKAETVTLFMPHSFGGSSSETFDEDSKLVQTLVDKNIPENSATQLAASLPKYWGGMSDPGEGTSGPVYLGVIAVLLFVIGSVVLKSHHRWWILAAVLFSILLSWGKYFPGFNQLMFNFLPLYNKFRAPSMALVIPQFLVPLLAVLALQQMLFDERLKNLASEDFKHILYAVGGLIALAGIVYILNDYSSGIDKSIRSAYGGQQGGPEIANTIISGLKADRKSMFGSDLLRTFGFALLLVGLLYLWLKRIVSPLVVIIVLIFVNFVDLFTVDRKYLSDENYMDAETYSSYNFKPSPADEAILKDTDPHFRVYNLSPDRFNEARTSYYHRSVGGYSPAKLSLYQDLIENQLSKQQLNMGVYNMLDTRYFLIPDEKGNVVNMQKNDSALGAAWFVRQLVPAATPAGEMKSLDSFNAKQTAFYDASSQKINSPFNFDPAATIRLEHYNNDTIQYKTTASSPQFAVFSEVYYPAGWNAYVDGKKTEYYKVNYLLRGMPVPAGDHTIEFRFEPSVYYTSYSVAFWSTVIMYLLILGGLIMVYRRENEINRTNSGNAKNTKPGLV